MEQQGKGSASRADWLEATLEILRESGVHGVKIVLIAKRMGLTSGSFYWHFRNLQELLDSVLDHWEHDLTDQIIQDAVAFEGAPEERIYHLMERVIVEGASEPDNAIQIWSKSNNTVKEVYNRTVQRRFDFAAWMFEEAGFERSQARVRGRVMVAYLMGESASGFKSMADWKTTLRNHWRFLVA